MPDCLHIEYVNPCEYTTDSAAALGALDLLGLAFRGVGDVLLDASSALEGLLLRLEDIAFRRVAGIVGACAGHYGDEKDGEQGNGFSHG